MLTAISFVTVVAMNTAPEVLCQFNLFGPAGFEFICEAQICEEITFH